MLVMSALGIFVVIVNLAAGIAMFTLYKETSANICDSIALTAAIKLNEMDQTGRMNNLISQSRAGIYLSREQYDKTRDARFISMEPLARHLLEGARWSSKLVDQAREQMIQVRLAEVQQIILKDERIANGQYVIARCEFGELKEQLSNVPLRDLEQPCFSDRTKGFYDRDTGLFRADVDARLPGEDQDLPFRFSDLPATFENKALPASLIRNKRFISRGDLIVDGSPCAKPQVDTMPSAIRLRLVGRLQGSKVNGEMSNDSLACTNGAQPME